MMFWLCLQVGAAWTVCPARDAERGTDFPTVASTMETGNKGILIYSQMQNYVGQLDLYIIYIVLFQFTLTLRSK